MQKTDTTQLQDFNTLIAEMDKKPTDALRFQLTEERHLLSSCQNDGDTEQASIHEQNVSAIEHILEKRD